MDNLSFSFFQDWLDRKRQSSGDIHKQYIGNSVSSISHRMNNIVELYKKVWNEMKPEIHKMYIYDDIIYDKICQRVDEFINNKLKVVGNDQKIYVGDIEIDKDEDNYNQYFKGSETKFKFIINKIFEDIKNIVELSEKDAEALSNGAIPSFIREYVSVNSN